MKMTSTVLDMLIGQMGHEMQNSILYSNIESLLKFEGLENLAHHFHHQVEEEFNHANMIAHFLDDRNEMFTMPTIQTMSFEDYDVRRIIEFYVAREQETTNSIEAVLKQSLLDGDMLSYDFLLKFVSYQREEEATAQSLYDKIIPISENKGMLILFDNTYKS